MKISIFPRFGASNSAPVFGSFSKGAKELGYQITEHDLTADIFVIWSVLWHGKMKSNQEIWNYAKKYKKKLIILEVGGLHRGTTWRIGVGHVNNLGFFGSRKNFDHQRPEKIGVSLKFPEIKGEKILICGQHTKSEQWSTRPPPEKWLSDLIANIKKYSDRDIVFRPHPRDYEWCQKLLNLDIEVKIPRKIPETYDDFNHEEDFLDAWCVFNPCSNTGIQAAILGIPVFTDPDSLAYPVSNKNLLKIENPETFDKRDWLVDICNTEWTVEELERGYPLNNLF